MGLAMINCLIALRKFLPVPIILTLSLDGVTIRHSHHNHQSNGNLFRLNEILCRHLSCPHLHNTLPYRILVLPPAAEYRAVNNIVIMPQHLRQESHTCVVAINPSVRLFRDTPNIHLPYRKQKNPLPSNSRYILQIHALVLQCENENLFLLSFVLPILDDAEKIPSVLPP